MSKRQDLTPADISQHLHGNFTAIVGFSAGGIAQVLVAAGQIRRYR